MTEKKTRITKPWTMEARFPEEGAEPSWKVQKEFPTEREAEKAAREFVKQHPNAEARWLKMGGRVAIETRPQVVQLD